VKTAKGLFNRNFVNTQFTYEKLLTVVVEIEAILNSRPLTPKSSDPNDLSALTANYFLTGRSLRSMPELIVHDSKASTLQWFTAVTALKQSFWHRWSTDYFNALRSRSKWTSPLQNVAVSTMVLIHEDNVPPQDWRMGKIESLMYGSDNRVRVVQQRTAKETCCRPVHKLAVLLMSWKWTLSTGPGYWIRLLTKHCITLMSTYV